MPTHEPVRWGILGTGGITRKFLAGARRSSAVKIIAVGSRTAQRAEAHGAEHGIERTHASYERLLADPLVEAIYISLPNSLHHPWALRALEAGKHVLCEKPYSRRPADVVDAFDAAEAAGLLLSEAFMWRHHPQARRIVELMPELGALQVIRATFGFVLTNDADVRVQPELDGGSLMDVGCYCVSGARLLAGEEPELVYGVSTAGPSGVDVRFTGVLQFPSGVVAEFTAAFVADHRGLEAIGSAGSALMTDPWQSNPAVIVLDGKSHAFDGIDPYQLEIEDMSAAIREGRRPLLGRADALGQARTIDALYRSAATGIPVRL